MTPPHVPPAQRQRRTSSPSMPCALPAMEDHEVAASTPPRLPSLCARGLC
jgi:hypothetical protein